MAHHHLAASVETVHWGWFQSTLKPVLTIDSGDRVTVQTVSGGPANLPGPGHLVPPELQQIHDRSERRLPGHILTGPIHVRGAEPGDVLELRVLDVRLRQDWGYTFVRPLAGAPTIVMAYLLRRDASLSDTQARFARRARLVS